MATALKEKIIERMEAKNFSIAELERRAGLSIHSVRNILKGRIKKPSAQSLHAIAEALECSIIDLMNPSSAIEAGFPQDIERRIKKRPLLDYPELMQTCLETVLKQVGDKQLKLTIDEYFEVVKKVYLYSSREEPRKVDSRFAEWLLESQFEDRAYKA
jgi:transcriptional regulator with XRE-family HTH domain